MPDAETDAIKVWPIAVGNDATNLLIDLYMNGFVTGASSALATYTQADDETADRLTDHLAEELRSDPLAVETVRQQIAETFTGTDTGEKRFNLPATKHPLDPAYKGVEVCSCSTPGWTHHTGFHAFVADREARAVRAALAAHGISTPTGQTP